MHIVYITMIPEFYLKLVIGIPFRIYLGLSLLRIINSNVIMSYF